MTSATTCIIESWQAGRVAYRGLLICSTVSFSIFGGIYHLPRVTYFLPCCLFCLLLLLGLQLYKCPNISDLGPLNCFTCVGNRRISSLVNTEPNYLFNSSAITNPSVSIFPELSPRCPTYLISNMLLTSYIRIETLTV